jgi:menaquinone-dependent protoporphyrinogen oxidase
MAPALQPDAAEVSMANVLIVYATKEGQTEKIARHIADTVQRAGHDVMLVDVAHEPAPADLAPFDAILVGAPLHGTYPRCILRFVRAHRALLEQKQAAFFSVGLAVASRTSDGRAQTLAVVDHFVQSTGWRPARVELIAGALPYSKYNFLVKFVMRRISAHEGGDTDTSRDYEYTDWPAVERFARELVSPSAPA